jgi:glycine hydroxymethyltransferase
MRQDEMKKVGAWILRVLKAPEDLGVIETVKGEIREFAKAFPVPGIA